jgi:hypothetical protein
VYQPPSYAAIIGSYKGFFMTDRKTYIATDTHYTRQCHVDGGGPLPPGFAIILRDNYQAANTYSNQASAARRYIKHWRLRCAG